MESKSIHKILVPVDFSETAVNALDYACSLSTVYKSEVIIYHVNEAPILLTNELAIAADYSVMEKEANDRLKDIQLKMIAKYPLLLCSNSYSVGISSMEILKKIETDQIDLVVMGTNGASGISEVLIGSITQKVSAESTCPVLVIPAQTSVHNPEKIVFATNFDDHELQAIFLLSELVRPFKTEIDVVHIGDAADLKSQNLKLDYFRGQVTTNISYEKLKFDLVTGDNVEEALEKFVANNNADWLAVAKRKRNFFDRLTSTSLSKKLSFHTNVPLLVFHTNPKSGTPFF